MIICSESSINRSDVSCFVQNSTIISCWCVAVLFQYTFGETFTAKFKFVRGYVIATKYLATQT